CSEPAFPTTDKWCYHTKPTYDYHMLGEKACTLLKNLWLLAAVSILPLYTQCMIPTLRKQVINASHQDRYRSGMLPQGDFALTPSEPAVSILRSTSGEYMTS